MRSCAITLVVLAAAALAAPSSASAGCSHADVTGTTHASILASLDRIPLPAAPGRPAKPCDGPSCSGRPAEPMTSPVAPRALRTELWGCLMTALAPRESAGRPVTPGEIPARAAHHGLRVDRPPRDSALPRA
jgi:hypothetical protein